MLFQTGFRLQNINILKNVSVEFKSMVLKILKALKGSIKVIHSAPAI